jgi:putative membrane protein
MRHVREALSDQDRAEIERAIAAAESVTSAEIVVAFAGRSGRYQRASDLFGLALALAAVAAAWIIWQSQRPNPADWGGGFVPSLGLGWILVIFASWLLIGAMVADSWPALARPFMTRGERLAAVRRRGFEAFHALRVGRTRDATGLLIFASLLERTVWVCPDSGIASRLGADEAVWRPVSDLVAAGFRSGRPGPAIADAIRKAGAILAVPFPPGPADADELTNQVRFVDDRGEHRP